jgi:hypothetical protein
MALQPKSIALFAATFVVAFALGLFVDARLIRGRRDRRQQMDGRVSPFVARIENAVRPHSNAQRDSLDVALQKVASDNAATMSAAMRQTRAHTDSLRVVLAPMLDSAQRMRLDSSLIDMQTGVFGRARPRRAAPLSPPP